MYMEESSKLSQKNRQIISKIIKNALIQKTINVYGHGKYFRDYVHVKKMFVWQFIEQFYPKVQLIKYLILDQVVR